MAHAELRVADAEGKPHSTMTKGTRHQPALTISDTECKQRGTARFDSQTHAASADASSPSHAHSRHLLFSAATKRNRHPGWRPSRWIFCLLVRAPAELSQASVLPWHRRISLPKTCSESPALPSRRRSRLARCPSLQPRESCPVIISTFSRHAATIDGVAVQ